MMYRMIPIIPANPVVFCVDAVDGILFGIVGINEGMLGPVAKHHHHTGKQKRNNKNKKSRLEIDKTHSDAKNKK